MRFRVLVPGLVVLGMVSSARAEIDVGTYSVRSFDLLDAEQNVVGELVITTSEYAGSTNLSVASEHWYWASDIWIDHFGIQPTAAGDHSIATPSQRYPHSLFPQEASAMSTIGAGPKAWQVSREGLGGTTLLDVVLTVDQGTGAMTWAAAAGGLGASRLVGVADDEVLWFDLITSNPQSMPADTAVHVVSAAQQ